MNTKETKPEHKAEKGQVVLFSLTCLYYFSLYNFTLSKFVFFGGDCPSHVQIITNLFPNVVT